MIDRQNESSGSAVADGATGGSAAVAPPPRGRAVRASGTSAPPVADDRSAAADAPFGSPAAPDRRDDCQR